MQTAGTVIPRWAGGGAWPLEGVMGGARPLEGVMGVARP